MRQEPACLCACYIFVAWHPRQGTTPCKQRLLATCTNVRLCAVSALGGMLGQRCKAAMGPLQRSGSHTSSVPAIIAGAAPCRACGCLAATDAANTTCGAQWHVCCVCAVHARRTLRNIGEGLSLQSGWQCNHCGATCMIIAHCSCTHAGLRAAGHTRVHSNK